MEILNYINEIWKPVRGYEGLYEVSSFGRVKSLAKEWISANGSKNCHGDIILKQGKDKVGYCFVSLMKNKNRKQPKIHRLVAEAFLPNPDNLPQVNHKNEIKNDNRVENLEWCTRQYNINYGTGIKRRVASVSIPVLQFSMEGKIIQEFQSMTEAERKYSKSKKCSGGNICNCCKGKLNSAYGFIWKYKSA